MNIQEDIRKQIVQELKINQASQCPHVVICYHSFYHNGAISLVFEYMDRGSLADVIRQLKTILEPYLAVVCKQVSLCSIFGFFLYDFVCCTLVLTFLLVPVVVSTAHTDTRFV